MENKKEKQAIDMYRCISNIKRKINTTEDIKKLRDISLNMLEIIRGYASEIREPYNNIDLFELGFCQGEIYTTALSNIERMLDE